MNCILKMEKLQVENKWKLIIYENIKTSYIKDYYLDTEETLYCDIFLEKLKIDPLYDKIQYNEFLKNISPLLKKELLDTAENYEIEILVDKYPITNNKISISNPNTKNESPIVVENDILEPICHPMSTTSSFNPVAFTI